MYSAALSNSIIAFALALINLAVWALAVARVAWRQSTVWSHGWWSRAGWILAASYLTWSPWHGLVIPVGAAAAIYRTRRRPDPPPVDPVPFASGGPDWNYESDIDPEGGWR